MDPITTPPSTANKPVDSRKILAIVGGIVLLLLLALAGRQLLKTDIVGVQDSPIKLSTDKLLYRTGSGLTVPVTVSVQGATAAAPVVAVKLTLDGLPDNVSLDEDAITGTGSTVIGRARVQRTGAKAIILISDVEVNEDGPFMTIPLYVTSDSISDDTTDTTRVVQLWSDPTPGSAFISQIAVRNGDEGDNYVAYSLEDGPFFRLSPVQSSPTPTAYRETCETCLAQGKSVWCHGGFYIGEEPTSCTDVMPSDDPLIADAPMCEICVPPSPTPTPQYWLKVKNPNGGEILPGGSTTQITWESSDNLDSAQVSLDLQEETNAGWQNHFIATVANTGSHLWTVPNLSNTNKYRIAARAIDASAAEDISDAAFHIAITPAFKKLTPGSGATLSGSTTFSWTRHPNPAYATYIIQFYGASGELPVLYQAVISGNETTSQTINLPAVLSHALNAGMTAFTWEVSAGSDLADEGVKHSFTLVQSSPTPTGTGSLLTPSPTPTPIPSPSPTTAPVQCSLPLRGDVNCDGRITIADLVLAADFLAGKAKLSDSQLANANVAETSQGRVNLADVAAFLQFLTGQNSTL